MKKVLSNPIHSLPGYTRVPIWNELTLRVKVEIAALAMWQVRCLAFSVHIQSDYASDLVASGVDIRERMRDNLTTELRAAGLGHVHNLFSVEDRDKQGELTGSHLHGMIQVADPPHDEVVKAALLRVAGQGTGGRPKEDRAISLEPVYDALGWARYLLKHIGKRSDTLPERRVSFARCTSQLAKLTYETMTGAASAASFVIMGYVSGRLTPLNLSRIRPSRRRLAMFRQVERKTAIQQNYLNISALRMR